jgi:outer membrane murein-binding lipoprotein Lpp
MPIRKHRTRRRRAQRSAASFIIAALAALGIAGCGGPSAVNIQLRKQNQTLQAQVDQLTAQHQRDVATLAASEKSHPTTRMLGPDQLDQLVTTHGLKVANLTGGDNPDTAASFDNQLKVYAVPIDGDGTPIKAAGSFKVEAFDLDDPKKPLIGTWNFDLNQTRTLFYSQFLLYTYVLNCPWQTVPAHADLTLRITFADALTGREFTEQVQVKVRPPASRS